VTPLAPLTTRTLWWNVYEVPYVLLFVYSHFILYFVTRNKILYFVTRQAKSQQCVGLAWARPVWRKWALPLLTTVVDWYKHHIGGSHVEEVVFCRAVSCGALEDMHQTLAGNWHVVLAGNFAITRKQPAAWLKTAYSRQFEGPGALHHGERFGRWSRWKAPPFV
jgi:hypothetical protein